MSVHFTVLQLHVLCSPPLLCVNPLQLNLKFKIDDPCNASGVHFYAGMWGLMAPALFASEANMSNAYGITGYVGVFYGGFDMIVPQAVAVGFVVGWTTVCMLPFFALLKMTGVFRVPLEVETVGMDASEHGGGALCLLAHFAFAFFYS